MIYLILYLTAAVLVAYIAAGWYLADFQKSYPNTASQFYRIDIENSWVFGAFWALIFPIGLILAYLLTGFAEHGWMNPLSFKRR